MWAFEYHGREDCNHMLNPTDTHLAKTALGFLVFYFSQICSIVGINVDGQRLAKKASAKGPA